MTIKIQKGVNMGKNSYFVIETFMTKQLKLKGNSLLVYAVIYGFSRDNSGYFKGSYEYIRDLTGIDSKTTIATTLQGLVKKGLVKKVDKFAKSGGANFYKVVDIDKIKPLKDYTKNCNSTMPKIDIDYTKNCNSINKDNIINSNSLINKDINNKERNKREKTSFSSLSQKQNDFLKFKSLYPSFNYEYFNLDKNLHIDFNLLDNAIQESEFLKSATFYFIVTNYDKVIKGYYKTFKVPQVTQKTYDFQREYSQEYFDSLITKVSNSKI